MKAMTVKTWRIESTDEPPVSGHPRDQKKGQYKRGVRLWEVKNVVFICS